MPHFFNHALISYHQNSTLIICSHSPVTQNLLSLKSKLLLSNFLCIHLQAPSTVSWLMPPRSLSVVVFFQCIDGIWQPRWFFSKRLQPAERNHCTFGRELLAGYFAIHHFNHNLEGRHFTVSTDHKPLTHALSASPDRYSPRQTHHLD